MSWNDVMYLTAIALASGGISAFVYQLGYNSGRNAETRLKVIEESENRRYENLVNRTYVRELRRHGLNKQADEFERKLQS